MGVEGFNPEAAHGSGREMSSEELYLQGIDMLLRFFGTVICAALFGMGYFLMSCRRRRRTAEAKLGEMEKEKEEWDSKSREILEKLAKDNKPARPIPLSALTNQIPSGASLMSDDSSMLDINKFDSNVIVNPAEVTALDMIGKGGFGSVYRGIWRGTPVAVKVIFLQEVHDQALQGIITEAETMAKLRHPNIVLYMGISVLEHKSVSIITELMERGSLFHVLHEKVPTEDGGRKYKVDLPVGRRLRFALEACRGLNYLHNLRSPIVHKDLKSLNLLVSADLSLKVADFGLSAIVKGKLLSAHAGGTPEWSAPEVLRGERHGLPCDIYSLGVVIWEIVTRSIPFKGLGGAQIISHVAFKGGRLPRAVPEEQYEFADCPEALTSLNDLIQACTDPDPLSRPTSNEVLGCIENIQAALTTSLSPSHPDGTSAVGRQADNSVRLRDIRQRPNKLGGTFCENLNPPGGLPSQQVPRRSQTKGQTLSGREKKGLQPLKLGISRLNMSEPIDVGNLNK